MRNPIAIGAVLAFMSAQSGYAGSVYKAETIVDFFSKAKAEAQNGQKRKVCFEGEACGEPARSFDLEVKFDFDSDRLTPTAQENLDQFAIALRNPLFDSQKFAIDGFTDATGPEVYNKGLSERRAEAVALYLTQRGIERGKLIAKGYGPAKPRAKDPFDPANRRVETRFAD